MIDSADSRGSKGVTLIELIIVLAILSLVIGTAFSLFGFGNKIFTFGSIQYDVQSATRIASQFITDETRYAADIQILDDISGVDLGNIPLLYNYLYYDNATGAVIKINSFGTVTKKIGTDGELNFSSTSPYKTLEYQITANEGSRSYNVSNQVYSLNLSLGTVKAVDTSITPSGAAIKYRTLGDYISGNEAPTVSIVSNSNTQIRLTFDKTVDHSSSNTLITDQGTTQSNRYGTLAFNGNDIVISFTQTVQNNRQLVFQVGIYGYDGTISPYVYTIKYSNSSLWTIQ